MRMHAIIIDAKNKKYISTGFTKNDDLIKLLDGYPIFVDRVFQGDELLMTATPGDYGICLLNRNIMSLKFAVVGKMDERMNYTSARSTIYDIMKHTTFLTFCPKEAI